MVDEQFYCTNCGTTSPDEGECCGTTRLAATEAEGFGLSEFEPTGTNSYETADDWN